ACRSRSDGLEFSLGHGTAHGRGTAMTTPPPEGPPTRHDVASPYGAQGSPPPYGGYGAPPPYPGGPAPYGQPPGAPRRPRLPDTLQIATILMFVIGGLGALWGLLIAALAVLFESLVRALVESVGDRQILASEEAARFVDLLRTIIIGTSLACFVLATILVVLGIFVRRAHNWARIVSSVLAVLVAGVTVALTFVPLAPLENMSAQVPQAQIDTTPVGPAHAAVVLVLALTPTVLMWVPASSAYFRERAEQRT
ncbi:MAG TPA: hypothetical protein VI076_00265, partial [Actinopolymorphaceae bacterium]